MKHRTNTTTLLTALVLAIAVALSAVRSTAAATDSFSGAIFTTRVEGTQVNGNIYEDGPDVYLNGGPQNQQAHGLPDGWYFFQVTDPAGRILLSTDPASCRQVLVSQGRIAGAAGNCPHANGTYNPANASLPVQLWPFAPTPNEGNEYKVWLIRQTPDTVVDPRDARVVSFLSKDCKTDSFKCRRHEAQTTGSPLVQPAPLTISAAMSFTVPNDAGQAGASVIYAEAIVSGGVGAVVVTYSQAAGSFFPLGTNTVTCTARDGGGTTAFAVFAVTVLDTEAPTLTPPGDVLAGNDPGQCGAVVAFALPTATDNSAQPVTVVCNPASGATFAVGTTAVNCAGTDSAGNVGACSFNVVVTDREAPSVSVPPSVTIECSADTSPTALGFATATDNCGASLSHSDSEAEGSNRAVSKVKKVITRTWKATDAAGLTATAAQIITVLDTKPPVLSGCSSDNPAVQCLAEVPSAPTVTANDACDGFIQVQFNQVESNPGSSCQNTITRTWTAVDSCGNVASHVQTILVNNTTPPVITQCAPDATVQCAGEVPLPSDSAVIAIDHCGSPVKITHDPDVVLPGGSPNRFTVRRTYHSTDSCGNHSECTQTITVNDTESPVVKCPANIVASNDPANCSRANVLFAATAWDNCPGVTLAYSIAPGSTFPVGTTSVTVTATDAAGNQAACTFTVTILLTENPGGLYPIALSAKTLAGVALGSLLPDIYNGTQPGNFGWLTWAGSPNEPTVSKSLTPPGDSFTYKNPANPADNVISIGDWVQGKPGVTDSKDVRNALDQLKTIDINVPIWDQTISTGNNTKYRVAGFAKVRITSYQLPGQNRISARYLGSACGQ